MTILDNPIFIATALASIVAQVIKTIIDTFHEGHFHWQSLFRGAGMPSSHTATVIALTLSVYLVEGLTTLFLVTFFIAAIVVRDVIGDKIFATHQQNIINNVVQQMMHHEKVSWNHLIGHSITEVLAGTVLGVSVTLLVFTLAR